MSLVGGQVITAARRSDFIVSRYTIQDLLSSLFKSELAGVEVKLFFYDTVDAFGKRVFIGVTILRHADGYSSISKYIHIPVATILRSSIRMMDQGFFFIGSIIQGSTREAILSDRV